MAPRLGKKATPSLSEAQITQLEAQKSESTETLLAQKIYQAWPITKSPGAKRLLLPGTKKRKMACPRSYRSKEYDLVDIRPGDDLNAIVSEYYNQRMTPQVEEEAMKKDTERKRKPMKSGDTEMERWVVGGGFGINYVAGEGVIQKRHEHLGPSPTVAGYQHLHSTEHDIRILWYDTFLKDRWCEKESWDISVKMNLNGKGEAEWAEQQT